MKKILLSLAVILCVGFVNAEQMVIDDLSEGIVNNVDSLLIPDNAVSDAQNVLFDSDSIAQKRKGMVKLNSTALSDSTDRNIYGQYEFVKSNGTRYHIVQAGATIYYRTSGDTFSVVKNDVSKTYPTNYAVFMDTMQFCNGVDNLSNWDTSKVGTTVSYQPRYIIAWSNRLCMAGDGDEFSKVRFSEWLDPNDITVPASNAISTDPVVFDINSQDGQKVTGMALSPNGSLLILKEKSCWEISGNDRDDYSLRLVNSSLGCVSDGSIAYREGDVYWLSSEGFVRYNGNSIGIISDNISNTVDGIQQLNAGTGQFTKDIYDEWAIYRSTANILVNQVGDKEGNIQLQKWYINQNDYIISNLVNCSSNTVRYITNDYNTNTTFNENVLDSNLGTISSGNSFDDSSRINATCFNLAHSGRGFVLDSNNNRFFIYLSYDTTYDIKMATSSVDDTGWGIKTVKTGLGNNVSFLYPCNDFGIDSSDNLHLIYSDNATPATKLSYAYSSNNGNSWTTYILDDSGARYGAMKIKGSKIHISYLDYVSGNFRVTYKYSTIGSGVFASTQPIVISGYASNIYTSIDATTSGDPVITYGKHGTSPGLYISSYNSTSSQWSEKRLYSGNDILGTKIFINNDNDIYIAATKDEYLLNMVYNNSIGTWTTTYFRLGYPLASDYIVTKSSTSILLISAGSSNRIICSSGTYISNIRNTGYTEPIFGLLTVDETDNAQDVYHYVRSSDTSTGVSGKAWTAVTKNTLITATTGQYIQYKCVISTNLISDNYTKVNSVVINYQSSASSNKLSSMCYDKRIWNAVSRFDSTLDHQLIYDTNGKWADFTSTIHCMSLLNYAGTPYFGSDEGYIYELDQGTSDSGNAIDSYFITKSYPLGSIVTYKNLSKMFLIAGYSGNWNLNLYYYLDRLTTANETFTIDLDQTPGIINYKIPFKKNTPFTTIQYKIFNSNADEPFDFYGLMTEYKMQPLR